MKIAKRVKIFLLLVFLIFKFNAFSNESKEIKISFYENFAPYSFRLNNQTKGVFVDISKLILSDMMGYNVKMSSFPWERAQDLVRKGEYNAHITVRTKERNSFLVFQDSGVIIANVALVYSKNNSRAKDIGKIRSKEEFNRFNMVGYIGDGWSKEQFRHDKDVHFYRTSNVENILKIINSNSADIYITSNNHSDKYIARKLGFKNLVFKTIHFLKPNEVIYRFCLSKEYPNAQKIVMEFEKNFLIAKKEGKIDKIIKSYFEK